MAAILPNYQPIVDSLTPVAVFDNPLPKEKHNTPSPVGQVMGFTGAVAAAGQMTSAQLIAAAAFKANIPEAIQNTLSSNSGAVAILMGLALSSDDSARAQQIQALGSRLSTETLNEITNTHTALATLPSSQRIPVAQLAAMRTKNLEPKIRTGIASAIETLSAADGKLTAFEAFYLEYLRHCLALPSLHPILRPAEAAERILCRLLEQQGLTQENFAAVIEGLALPPLRWRSRISTSSVREACASLAQFSYLQRRELLIAAGRAVKADGELSEAETEYLRLLAGCMDVPMPSRL